MLFPKWQGTIHLPALPVRRQRIGRNLLVQQVFSGAACKAQIFDSDLPGHDFIRTNLNAPFHELYLRRKAAQRRTASLPVVTGNTTADTSTWPATTFVNLTWDRPSGLEEYADTPGKVLHAWAHKFDFRTEDETTETAGLRTPQIGALHAIAAHFAVGKEFEAATVVLPTGTGKTETMLATQVYRRLERTLVLRAERSSALADRQQIHLHSACCLRLRKVIPLTELAR